VCSFSNLGVISKGQKSVHYAIATGSPEATHRIFELNLKGKTEGEVEGCQGVDSDVKT